MTKATSKESAFNVWREHKGTEGTWSTRPKKNVRDAFSAGYGYGAQSRQPEIDELKAENERLRKELSKHYENEESIASRDA